MTSRDPVLQDFLSSLRDALAELDLGSKASAAIDRSYGALARPEPYTPDEAGRLPACRYLPDALSRARRSADPIARIVESFETLEPSLRWITRSASGPNASANWPEGHANAMVVGPGGLERRGDVQIGVSLLAPHVRYPDHRHAPEEVYLVLSPGWFQHGESEWFEPGIGGTLYNEPDVLHAMRSGEAPLFAIWCLWAKAAA